MQLGFRSGKGPSELAVPPGLAGVDLRSGGMREENNLFTRGRFDRIWHVRRRFFLSVGQREPEKAC
jgi:hypothetical protein